MLTKTLLLVLTAVGFVQAAAIDKRAPPPPVFTATRVYKTITNVPPYIVDATTVITWTQGSTTSISNPTGTPQPH